MDEIDLPKTQDSLNLRWLLLSKAVARPQWVKYTSTWLTNRKDDEVEASGMLNDFWPPSDRYQSCVERICDHFGVEADHFMSAPLYGMKPGGMLLENIQHLLNDLPHGGKKDLAAICDVKQETISRWIAGDQVPEKKNLRTILVHLGLPIQTDLATTPLFLSLSPVGAFAQKRWLLDTIKNTPPTEISKVFVAAKRMFRTHGAD